MDYSDNIKEQYNNYKGNKTIEHWLFEDYVNNQIRAIKYGLIGKYKDFDKEFKYGKISISREDYLEFGCPLDPTHTSDEEMLSIAKDIHEDMVSLYGEDYNLDFSLNNISAKFFELLELGGLNYGMIYLEDLKNKYDD